MQAALLQEFFDTSPAMHLLRSPNAPWIVAFLHQQFKSSGQIIWLHSALASQLDGSLQQLESQWLTSEVGPSANRSRKTKLSGEAYLAEWSSADCRWLKRFIDERHDEPVYQLTPEAELVLAFVAKATRAHPFIGTQSLLSSIIDLLQGVVDESSSDVTSEPSCTQAQRTHRLRAQFDMAVTQLEQLKSEFRGIEERFKAITRGVQQRLLQTRDSRGAILEYALDAEDLLKSGDQGQSFAEFLKLVHDPDRQTQLSRLVLQLTELEALVERHEELQSIRTMLPTLLAEAEKILRTTQHLSLTLRRLLDTRSSRHHRQLAKLLRDIRAAAAARSDAPPSDIGLEVEVEMEIQLPSDRPFWSQAEPFADVDWQQALCDPLDHAEALRQLVGLQRIDWPAMRRNITLALQSRSETSIQELLDRFPIKTGTIELLGYLQIAHEDGHQIDRDCVIELTSHWEGSAARVVRMPRVVFHRTSRGDRRKGSTSAELAFGHLRKESD